MECAPKVTLATDSALEGAGSSALSAALNRYVLRALSSWAVLIKCPGRWRAARGRKALARAYHLASIKEGKVEGQQPALINLTMPRCAVARGGIGMVEKTMSPIELAERLALVLALAFFLGLAFEETYKRDEPTIPGGIRTFPLVGLAGAMLYLVEPHWVLAFGAGLLAIGAWLFAFLWHERSLEMGSGRTLVVPVSNLLVYALGPIALTQPPWVAVGMTVAAVLVIGARERMHGFVRLIPQDEVLTAGKFLILVGIILPLVPDTQLIAISPVTPYHIWLAVVAISSLSYSTYLVQRYRPVKGGALLSALLGGAYSSTATTVVLAKRQKEAVTRRPELSAGIIAATAIMYPRLAAVIAFFSPPIAVVLLPGLGFLFTVAAAISWWEWRNIQPGYADDLAIPAANQHSREIRLIIWLDPRQGSSTNSGASEFV
jgi:uncharacterized membrane protein (DUF4010 family)